MYPGHATVNVTAWAINRPSTMGYLRPSTMGYLIPSKMWYLRPSTMGYLRPSTMGCPIPSKMDYLRPSMMVYFRPSTMGYLRPSTMGCLLPSKMGLGPQRCHFHTSLVACQWSLKTKQGVIHVDQFIIVFAGAKGLCQRSSPI